MHVTWRTLIRGSFLSAIESRRGFPSRQQHHHYQSIKQFSTLFATHSPPTTLHCQARSTQANSIQAVTAESCLKEGISISYSLQARHANLQDQQTNPPTMTQTEEFDEEAEAAGDESMTGPGAPTPLSALEVSLSPRNQVNLSIMCASPKAHVGF